ncbi:phospholipase D-like domain-containing protein [Vogesella sp. LIG4]|uniref:phospholipase D-like domain-containing protein n=1 Tax=Vogesella sp. LIG4 TaxID=1192162 RepID=UPI000820067A|nr:phospholipase D-like domain-containing protein [Vogesella sp. LIG4]SCK25685.1 hypothetical protein PSELUDRAFT_3066 [Vogesella sp. LIG4]
MGNKITTPVAANQGLQCTITPPWFVQQSEYSPLNGTFDFLINGERAFGEVHRAIAAAKQSVCIICWGFQPSMHFIRDGKSPSIGQLLEQKAAEGVKVRVLCYVVGNDYTTSLTGFSMDEPNMPNRSGPYSRGYKDVPATSSKEQNKLDSHWFSRYDRDRGYVQTLTKATQTVLGNKQVENLIFRVRGFSAADRAYLAEQEFDDKKVSRSMRAVLSAFPSHHQKMVLVDYGSPSDHVGFVMGHNMLDEYWDTCAHSYHRRTANTGRNGALPREDLSSRLTGPLCGDLFRNFAYAWEKETGESLDKPSAGFAHYPLREALGRKIQGQILRTQPQYRAEDIKKAYLQAVNNATQCIYVENQYFRWPPLADKIKQAAAKQCQWGRDPASHQSLYLFVVTNSSNAGMGSGTEKTHEMLKSLGRADAMPGVELQNRIQDQTTAINQAENRLRQYDASLGAIASGLPNPAVFKDGKYPPAWLRDPKTRELLEKHNQLASQRNRLQQEKDKMQQDLDLLASKEDGKLGQKMKAAETIVPEDRPGLKVHVCTLVPPDTPPGMAWPEVYVHSKLLLVNDTYMTLGSANINTRSMEVDSELNVAHCNPHISRQARLDLWNIHTGGKGAQADVVQAFNSWRDIIKENKGREPRKQVPEASLRGFQRFDPTQSNKD